MHVFPMDLWSLSTESRKIIRENRGDSLILIIHAITFSGLQRDNPSVRGIPKPKDEIKKNKGKNLEIHIMKNNIKYNYNFNNHSEKHN